MEIVSETIDENGKKHVVARYTDEEKAEMEKRAEEHKAEMEKRRAEMESKSKKRTAGETGLEG